MYVASLASWEVPEVWEVLGAVAARRECAIVKRVMFSANAPSNEGLFDELVMELEFWEIPIELFECRGQMDP